MSSPLILAVLIAYVNGAPIDAQIIGTTTSMETCKKNVEAVVAKSLPGIDKNVEVVVKCYDFSNAPIDAAGFGQKREAPAGSQKI